MDLLCTECAKVFAKEVDLIAHQARAHDTYTALHMQRMPGIPSWK